MLGGRVTCWSSKFFLCSEVLMSKFFLTIRLNHCTSGSQFYVTNVNGPPSWDGKEFCEKLATLKGVCNGLWVMCGDFNLTS